MNDTEPTPKAGLLERLTGARMTFGLTEAIVVAVIAVAIPVIGALLSLKE